MALRDIEIGKLYFVTEVPEGILCNVIGIPFRVSSISWPFLTVELATNQGRHIILDSRLATINRSNQEYFDKVATLTAPQPMPASPNSHQNAIDSAIKNGYSRHDLGGWGDT